MKEREKPCALAAKYVIFISLFYLKICNSYLNAASKKDRVARSLVTNRYC